MEPSNAMRLVNEGVKDIKFIDSDALSWVNSDDGHTYTHVLFKEMIHHVPHEQLEVIFAKLKGKLEAGGLALIVTRNQLYQDFPLPADVRYVCEV